MLSFKTLLTSATTLTVTNSVMSVFAAPGAPQGYEPGIAYGVNSSYTPDKPAMVYDSSLSPGSANLIKNGNFDSAAISAACLTANCELEDVNVIAPWKIESQQTTKFELMKSCGPQGQFCMDLNSNAPYTIYQEVPTTPGATYTLSASLNANRHCPTLNTFTGAMAVSGATVKDLVYDLTINKDAWMSDVSAQFVAKDATTKISFGSTMEGTCGLLITNVQVVRV